MAGAHPLQIQIQRGGLGRMSGVLSVIGLRSSEPRHRVLAVQGYLRYLGGRPAVNIGEVMRNRNRPCRRIYLPARSWKSLERVEVGSSISDILRYDG